MSFSQEFQIDGKWVGQGHPVYLIAEMSANHGGDLGRAREIVHAAAECGADAIKLQTYSADTLTMDCQLPHFYINDGPWQGQYLYDLYKGAMMPWDWHAELIELSQSLGVTCFSSPFDPTSIDLLEELNAPAYKIASPEAIELPLIRLAARTGKPVIISTGGASLAEINEALIAAAQEGATDVCLLKCTSSYPAPPESMNLATIPHLANAFGVPAGLSDHSMGYAVPVASVALGACMIEKHFVMNREDNTVDAFFSMTPDEFGAMVKAVRIAEQAIGQVEYPLGPSKHQRALYAIKDIGAGEELTADNVRSLRPGGGLAPAELDRVLGRQATVDIARGSQLSWALVGAAV